MHRYIDTHCHLDLIQPPDDVSQIILSAKNAGVDFLINPGIDIDSSKRILDLCQRYDSVFGAVGIHPNDIKPGYRSDIEQLHTMCNKKKIIAIGEIGLDYYHKAVPLDVQKDAFRLQLDLAKFSSLPVIIHSRDAINDVVDILADWVKPGHFPDRPNFLGVMYSFEGDPDVAHKLYEMGFLIGVGGPITYKNAELKRSVVESLPLDAILLETDSPYLTPEPHRGKQNEPAYIPLIGKRTAIIKACSEDQVASITTQNAMNLFNLGAVH